MADTELLDQDAPPEEQDESLEAEFGEAMPGEFCPVDATDDRIDLDDLSDEQKGALEELAKEASQRDLTSYRIEVRDAWKQRYFKRGNQYLLENKNGTYTTANQVLVGGQSYDDSGQKETNIYLAFADTIEAALTAGLPSVRFEAEDPSNPSDITASEKADTARKLLERANDMLTLQADLVDYLWTDGRALLYTHHIIDAQRFGWTTSDADPALSYFEENDALGGIREPRSQQVIEAYGVLETKLPIQKKTLDECDYLQFSQEHDVARLKTKYPDFAKDIVASAAPTAQSDYVRLARVSVNMGMRPSNMTNDAQNYNATEQLTWCRPSFFEALNKGKDADDNKDELVQWLIDTFPKGCMITMVGTKVVEARNESMDEHWTLFHARPGNGMHRPSLGYPLVSIQQKLNDCMDLVHQSFMHLIPRIWASPKIDLPGLEATARAPGQYIKAPPPPEGKAIADNFWAEPQIQLAEGLLVYIEKLFGEFSQFLCGAFPALFGGDTKSNDTARGIDAQRDQALGRIGLTWRSIKGGYARMMRQAVMGVGQYQIGKFSGELDTGNGNKEYLEIDPDDLKGNVKCFSETDESIPESWTMVRAMWTALRAEATKNPIIAKIIALPKNQLTMKDKTGTPELVIPEASSERKQLIEIKELLNSEPMPNPIAQAIAVQLKRLVASGAPPPVLQLAQQRVQGIKPFVSSVPIGKLDNHAFEVAAILTFASEQEGMKMKAAPPNPKGWQNLELHYDEHMAAIAQAAASAAQNKPPGESINYKDLESTDAKVQMLAQAGIHIQQADLEQELAKQKVEEDAKAAQAAAAKQASPGSGTGANQGTGATT